MALSVVIPFHSDDPWRIANLSCVTAQFDDVIVGGVPGLWCKARSAAVCLEQVTGDILAIVDADCLCDGLGDAVEAVQGGAAWSMPHRYVNRLSEDGSRTVEKRYQGTIGGGIVVLPTATYRDIPLDPRFVGWGQEDHSWGLALDCLAGPCVRFEHDLTHLWHPPPERLSRVYGSRDGRLLNRRYWHARDKPDVMRQIIDEAKEAMWTRPA